MSSLNIQPVYQARELYPTAVYLFSIKRYGELIQICRNTRELNPIIAPYCYYLEIRALLAQDLIEESFDLLSEAEKSHAGVPIIDEIFLTRNKKIHQSKIMAMDEWLESFIVYIQEDDDPDEDYEEMNFAGEDEDIYENMDKE